MIADDFRLLWAADTGALLLALYDSRAGSSVCVRMAERLPAALAEALAALRVPEPDGTDAAAD